MYQIIEDLSYYSDHRVTAQSKWYSHIDEKRMVVTISDVLRDILDDEGINYESTEVAFVWDVCSTCAGSGSHVNPSIDSHGLTAEDFHEDPDFAESYCRGDYDVPCYDCNGRRVVPVVSDPEILKALDDYFCAVAEMRAERLAELRMGA
jgi:hypothetical protein